MGVGVGGRGMDGKKGGEVGGGGGVWEGRGRGGTEGWKGGEVGSRGATDWNG